jgi:5-methylthioadenosine/S-adenosylhomocysteine deaminase
MRAALSGTTTVLDHHYAPTSLEATLGVADAIEAVGLRGAVARGMLGNVRPDSPIPTSLRRYSTSEDIAITRECMKERPHFGQVAVWPGPGSVHACDPDILIAAAELAVTHDCRWHTHTSESQRSVQEFLERHGARPITWLQRKGLLDKSVHAHAVHLDESEIDALSGSAGVAHCPVSNGYLASGVAPVVQLLSHGVTVGLGTDGAAVTGDGIAECGKHMMLLQRLANSDPACISADDALCAATRNAADMLGLDCGRLEVGRLADIVVLDLPQSLESSSHSPAVEIVGFPGSLRVRSVIVGGTSIVSNGRCTLIDETEVVRRAEGLGTRAARATTETNSQQ